MVVVNAGSVLDARMNSPEACSRSCPVADGVGALLGACHGRLQVPRISGGDRFRRWASAQRGLVLAAEDESDTGAEGDVVRLQQGRESTML